MIPINIVYWFAFAYLERQRKIAINEAFNNFLEDMLPPDEDEVVGLNTPSNNVNMEPQEDVDSLVNQNLSLESLKLLWPRIGYFLLNLGLVRQDFIIT
jgi:hypothetical protein